MPNTVRVAEANLNMDPEYDAHAPMTNKQTAKLRDLCADLDEEFDAALDQKQAYERIIELEKMRDA